MFVEGYVRSTSGEPIANAIIDTWEADAQGEYTNGSFSLPILIVGLWRILGIYDTQKIVRDVPDCRGRLRTDKDGKYSYRAIVPMAYPVPGDVSSNIYIFLQQALLICQICTRDPLVTSCCYLGGITCGPTICIL